MKISSVDGDEGQRYQGCKVNLSGNNRKPQGKCSPGNDLMCYRARTVIFLLRNMVFTHHRKSSALLLLAGM